MNKFLQLFFFIIILGCSPKIKSVTEYRLDENEKSRMAEFSRKGYKTIERNFGNPRSNRVIKFHYENGKKIRDVHCDHFVQEDTCVTRQFSVYKYYPDDNLKVQTIYEEDSAIRLIREIHEFKDLQVINVNTWEMFPSKDPDPAKAMKLTDSVFFDTKGREVKRVHYNEAFINPWTENLKYSDSGHVWEVIRPGMDTVRVFKPDYKKLFKMEELDFEFRDTATYRYEFEYY